MRKGMVIMKTAFEFAGAINRWSTVRKCTGKGEE